MNRTRIARTVCAFLAIALLAPAGALAHDGTDNRSARFGHHHHHFGVLLKGVVSSVDTSNGTLTFKVDKSTRGGKALVGDTVTAKVFRAWTADTNNDGSHNLADVKDGDTVLVKTKRRFINSDANTIAAAKVFDKTNLGTTAFRRADSDGDRDGRCDHS